MVLYKAMKITHTGEGIYSSVNGSEETRFVYEMEYKIMSLTMECKWTFILHAKVNTIWIRCLNIKPETIKLLEKVKENLITLDLEMISRYDTKSTGTKSKNKHAGLHKIKLFCTATETYQQDKNAVY